MKHVLLVTTSFPGQVEGAEAAGSFVADFADALARNVRVTVLCPATVASTSYIHNCCVIRFKVPCLPLSLLRISYPGHWPAIISTLIAGRHALHTVVTNEHVDHVLALWALPSGWWARTGRRTESPPYSIWSLGSDIWSLSHIPVIRHVLKRTLLGAKCLFADGKMLCDEVKEISGREVLFVPSSRKLPAIEKKHRWERDKVRLAFLGRWHHNKGIDILMDALDLLDDDDWLHIEQIRIYGGGPLFQNVSQRIDRLVAKGLPVVSGGYQDKAGAANLLAWTDYLIIPSRIESIPVIFSDAMQSECAVISTPVGDMPAIINKYECGLLADSASAAAIARTIRLGINTDPGGFKRGINTAASDFDINRAAAVIYQAINSE